ncbi:MAG: hypothetical protein AAF226_04485 [Verrucomicrobiota bacterium]
MTPALPPITLAFAWPDLSVWLAFLAFFGLFQLGVFLTLFRNPKEKATWWKGLAMAAAVLFTMIVVYSFIAKTAAALAAAAFFGLVIGWFLSTSLYRELEFWQRITISLLAPILVILSFFFGALIKGWIVS